VAVRDAEWAQLSVGPGECPGASRCPHGPTCFAEGARATAADADVVVVNTHLYGLHLATGGALLPDHDVVVFDEAHALADVAADTLGLAMGPGRVVNLARAVRGLFRDHPAATQLDGAAARLDAVLGGMVGERVDLGTGELAAVLLGCARRPLPPSAPAGSSRRPATARPGGSGSCSWPPASWATCACSASPAPARSPGSSGPAPRLCCGWRRSTWGTSSRRGCSPTSPPSSRAPPSPWVAASSRPPPASASTAPAPPAPDADGSDPGPAWRGIDVGSPFDYGRNALLYCAAHLPDPRAPGYEAAMLAELTGLVTAAGGRTLALFTSKRAMTAAALHLAASLDVPVLVQDELPRPVLQRRFLDEEPSVLVATMGFWQGFDAPGPTCSLVTIDRLPFARPDDPLADARREAATRARRNAFAAVDLPDAATLLAQGAGRLIRTATDEGVVAVLDRRLASASYRWMLVRSLPPMRRTKDPEEARRVLSAIAAARAGTADRGCRTPGRRDHASGGDRHEQPALVAPAVAQHLGRPGVDAPGGPEGGVGVEHVVGAAPTGGGRRGARRRREGGPKQPQSLRPTGRVPLAGGERGAGEGGEGELGVDLGHRVARRHRSSTSAILATRFQAWTERPRPDAARERTTASAWSPAPSTARTGAGNTDDRRGPRRRRASTSHARGPVAGARSGCRSPPAWRRAPARRRTWGRPPAPSAAPRSSATAHPARQPSTPTSSPATVPSSSLPPVGPGRGAASEELGGERRDLGALAVRQPHVPEQVLAREGVDEHGDGVRVLAQVRGVDLARVTGEDDLGALADPR
jgi:ATP-dependent DNA helicase DinG